MKARVVSVATLLLVAATILACLAALLDWPSWLRGPAPYPPDWQWPLRPEPDSGRFTGVLVAAAGLLAALAASGSAAARRNPRRASVLLVALGIPLAFAFALGLLRLEPDGAVAALTARTTSVGWNSYHTVATSEVARDPLVFLRRHGEIVRSLPKHAATHPPGPVLYYRSLVALCSSSPRLTAVLQWLQDPEAPRRPPTEGRIARAGALLGALGLVLLGAASIVPVASLAGRLSGDPLAGARAGLVWGLVPAPALFVPQIDHALALPVAATVALLAAAAAEPQVVRRTLAALAAGACAAVALFLSYGSVAFLAIGGGAVLAGARLSRLALAAVALALGAAVLLTMVPALLGADVIGSALAALAVHREVYTAPRGYGRWLVANPVDALLFLGPPLAVLGIFRLREALPLSSAADRFALAIAAGLGVLLLSGVTRGEVGRLWIPLFALATVAVLAAPAEGARPAQPTREIALLVAALLVPLDLVLRVRWLL